MSDLLRQRVRAWEGRTEVVSHREATPPTGDAIARSGQSLLNRPVQSVVAEIAVTHLDTAAAAIVRLSDPKDRESLHDFRVAVRRLRSLLRAYRPWMRRSATKKVQRALRRLGRSPNAGRDAEVHIEWLERQRNRLRRRERAGLNWLLKTLKRVKRRSYQKARLVVRSDFKRADVLVRRRLARDTDEASVPFGYAFGTLLEAHAADLEVKLSSVRSPEDEEHSHESRIMAKRLRYLLEPTSDVVEDARANVKQLKRVQDLLGDLHDTHVLATTLRGALQDMAAEKTRRMYDLAVAGRLAEVERERRRDERLGLVALVALVRKRRDELFAQLDNDWFHGRADFTGRLQAQGLAIVTSLLHRGKIDSKFLSRNR